MGEGSLIDIVLFAMVAAFLFLRLRSVLGRRTGQERPRPNPFARPTEQQQQQRPEADAARPFGDGVVPLPTARVEPIRPRVDPTAAPTPLATGLAEIKLADPNFHEDSFLAGSRVAF